MDVLPLCSRVNLQTDGIAALRNLGEQDVCSLLQTEWLPKEAMLLEQGNSPG